MLTRREMEWRIGHAWTFLLLCIIVLFLIQDGRMHYDIWKQHVVEVFSTRSKHVSAGNLNVHLATQKSALTPFETWWTSTYKLGTPGYIIRTQHQFRRAVETGVNGQMTVVNGQPWVARRYNQCARIQCFYFNLNNIISYFACFNIAAFCRRMTVLEVDCRFKLKYL